ncbi:MAG: 1-acyl-sn-glycerol-3-phosphate acyltransferase [Deltaproteobacteria bacterium]|nr:1-acyl-sn-glycerol-3-phosphate acyltransferase [Deltaproteobacteria bacterium]
MISTRGAKAVRSRDSVLYALLHPLVWCWVKVFYLFRLRGLAHVPRTGGALLASNHASYFDPVWVGCAVLHRQITIISTTSVGRVPGLGRLVRSLNALTILKRQGFNKEAIKEFVRVVRDDDRLLLIFPEGARSADGALQPTRRGISLLAREARVPVVPVLITGSHEVWPKGRLWPTPWGRVAVTFGAPLKFEDVTPAPGEEPDHAFSRVLMERVAALIDSPDDTVPFLEGLKSILWRE